jgi:ketosteroid isomerase-like protein
VAEDLPQLMQRFADAFNSRDPDALLELVTDDVVFRGRQGAALHGEAGARELLIAAEDARIRLEPDGVPHTEDDGRVTLPVRVFTGKDHIDGTAVFEVRDGKIAAFEVVSDD